jgi:putative ABC transport system permease protein
MIRDYFVLGIKNLRNRRIRSWLTMIGIFIGIASVVALISLGQGLKGAILSQFSEAGSDKLVVQAAGLAIGPPGSGVIRPLTEKDADAVRRVTGVNLVAERLIRIARVEFRSQQNFLILGSLPTDKSRALVTSVMRLEVESGRLLTPNDASKVIVGNDLATKKIFDKKLVVGDKLIINGRNFEIVGVMTRLGNPLFNQLILMNDKVMKDTLGIIDEIDIMAVQVKPDADILKVAEDIKKELRKSRDVKKGKEDFSVQTPAQAVEALNKILSYAQWFLVGIAFISIVVGAIGIMNTMYTSVLERRREIGIMKSVGARNSHIFTLFLIESGLLGTLGGLIGILLGVGLSQLIVLSMGAILGPNIIQAEYPLLLIAGSLGFSFVVGSAAGTLPAVQAAKLHPVDALRK